MPNGRTNLVPPEMISSGVAFVLYLSQFRGRIYELTRYGCHLPGGYVTDAHGIASSKVGRPDQGRYSQAGNRREGEGQGDRKIWFQGFRLYRKRGPQHI